MLRDKHLRKANKAGEAQIKLKVRISQCLASKDGRHLLESLHFFFLCRASPTSHFGHDHQL